MYEFMAKLSDKIPMVSLQFNFGNDFIIPWNLKTLETETKKESEERRARNANNAKRTQVNTSKSEHLLTQIDSRLPPNLVDNGYVLVTTIYQKKLDKNLRNQYNMVRYSFFRKEYVQLSNPGIIEITPRRGLAIAQLYDLILLSYWQQVRVYRNPFTNERITMADKKYALSINFDARYPLYEGNKYPENLPTPKCKLILDSKKVLSMNTVF